MSFNVSNSMFQPDMCGPKHVGSPKVLVPWLTFHGKEELDVDVEMLNWEAVVHCLWPLTTCNWTENRPKKGNYPPVTKCVYIGG